MHATPCVVDESYVLYKTCEMWAGSLDSNKVQRTGSYQEHGDIGKHASRIILPLHVLVTSPSIFRSTSHFSSALERVFTSLGPAVLKGLSLMASSVERRTVGCQENCCGWGLDGV